jgi:hypothetical protein
LPKTKLTYYNCLQLNYIILIKRYFMDPLTNTFSSLAAQLPSLPLLPVVGPDADENPSPFGWQPRALSTPQGSSLLDLGARSSSSFNSLESDSVPDVPSGPPLSVDFSDNWLSDDVLESLVWPSSTPAPTSSSHSSHAQNTLTKLNWFLEVAEKNNFANWAKTAETVGYTRDLRQQAVWAVNLYTRLKPHLVNNRLTQWPPSGRSTQWSYDAGKTIAAGLEINYKGRFKWTKVAVQKLQELHTQFQGNFTEITRTFGLRPKNEHKVYKQWLKLEKQRKAQATKAPLAPSEARKSIEAKLEALWDSHKKFVAIVQMHKMKNWKKIATDAAEIIKIIKKGKSRADAKASRLWRELWLRLDANGVPPRPVTTDGKFPRIKPCPEKQKAAGITVVTSTKLEWDDSKNARFLELVQQYGKDFQKVAVELGLTPAFALVVEARYLGTQPELPA